MAFLAREGGLGVMEFGTDLDVLEQQSVLPRAFTAPTATTKTAAAIAAWPIIIGGGALGLVWLFGR